ncbi:MAG: hypothetical protein ICV83_05930 [Cytophagales bacterium]|nr:hypothetical protein [Cytophagales bacterium]
MFSSLGAITYPSVKVTFLLTFRIVLFSKVQLTPSKATGTSRVIILAALVAAFDLMVAGVAALKVMEPEVPVILAAATVEREPLKATGWLITSDAPAAANVAVPPTVRA